tara:strand:+ start:710 stop:832 length:123 start_codon:yes stop_codon:yes gene_type:complete
MKYTSSSTFTTATTSSTSITISFTNFTINNPKAKEKEGEK